MKNHNQKKQKDYRMGAYNPFYGKTHSAEVRQILSAVNKGNKNAWKTGISRTLQYRNETINFLGKKCSSCGKENNLIIHHIDGNRRNNEYVNLLLLCLSCHSTIHSLEKGKKNVYYSKLFNKWIARFNYHEKRYTWVFNTREEAIALVLVVKENIKNEPKETKQSLEL